MTSTIRQNDIRDFEVERCNPAMMPGLDSENRKMTGEEVWGVLHAWLAVRNGVAGSVAFPGGVVLGKVAELKKEFLK